MRARSVGGGRPGGTAGAGGRGARWLRSARLGLLSLLAGAAGCSSSLEQIDRQVDAMLAERSGEMNALAPEIGTLPDVDEAADPSITADWMPTANPPADELQFRSRGTGTTETESDDLIRRLQSYSEMPADAARLDLRGAIEYAYLHGRDHEFAEEQYVLAGLRLLREEHRWGPRFFDDIEANVAGAGTDGFFDSSLRVVNDLRVTQRLPYGGEVSARALATAVEELHGEIANGGTQSTTILLDGTLPLMRGAGTVAREPLIQSRRDVIYDARGFERFRRTYAVDICAEFLGLVVRQRSIENSRAEVKSLDDLTEREGARYEAGWITRYEAAQTEERAAASLDSLNSQMEQYRLAVDRFKVRIGMPPEMPLIIETSRLDLPIPNISTEDAVELAMRYRLDLQNQRDQLDDAERAVANARNDLLPDLDVFGSVEIPTDPDKDRSGLQFSPKDLSYAAGVRLGLPLDREIERLSLRQTQIALERARRNYQEFRDTVAVQARAAVRDIDRALYSFQIQELSIEIAEERLASVRAQPERVEPRDASDAVIALTRTQDARDASYRDLQLAILDYLLETGQLRVGPGGVFEPPGGMDVAEGTGSPVPAGTDPGDGESGG